MCWEVENEDVVGAAPVNYIWVINNFIAYKGAPYIRDLMVLFFYGQTNNDISVLVV